MSLNQKDSLYFVGFQGRLNYLMDDAKNISYVLDANVVLNLIRYRNGKEVLSDKKKKFLKISTKVAKNEWECPAPKIAINPFLAIMELTKQHTEVSFDNFELMFNDLIQGVYGLSGYDPSWVLHTYENALHALVSTHPSIALMVSKTYSLIGTPDKPTDAEIIVGCEQLLSWLWRCRENLALIGGSLLYIAVYAIAGSPDAQNILKIREAKKGNADNTASNVAWDFLYWVLQEIEYHRAQFSDTIVCTSDRALAQLLGSRINQGPRIGINSRSKPRFFESYGEIQPFKFQRLENSKLEKELKEMIISFFSDLARMEDKSFKFGFNPYVVR